MVGQGCVPKVELCLEACCFCRKRKLLSVTDVTLWTEDNSWNCSVIEAVVLTSLKTFVLLTITETYFIF